jgi:ribulose-5-phosphate 4-epimerase/fuculose-1-phosphate aldolase
VDLRPWNDATGTHFSPPRTIAHGAGERLPCGVARNVAQSGGFIILSMTFVESVLASSSTLSKTGPHGAPKSSPARLRSCEPRAMADSPIDAGPFKLSFQPPTFESLADERVHRKQRLAAAFRLFSRFGFDEGVAGHITVRDPEHTDTFWVNPFGVHFGHVKASNLIRVDHDGDTIEGTFPVNRAAYAIHSRIHKARPDVVAAAHSHSLHGKAFSSLGTLLSPITQDACAFYGDHAVYDDFGGVVVDLDEGARIARTLGDKKAVILQNHGLLTVGGTVDAAAWWFITMERS